MSHNDKSGRGPLADLLSAAQAMGQNIDEADHSPAAEALRLHCSVMESVCAILIAPSGDQTQLGLDADSMKAISLALDAEERAGYMLRPTAENEPARSLYFLLAASLAVLLRDYDRANMLAIRGLQGDPPMTLYVKLDYIREMTGKATQLKQAIIREMPALIAASPKLLQGGDHD